MQFSGSWYFDRKYAPKLMSVSGGTRWAIRFKMFGHVRLRRPKCKEPYVDHSKSKYAVCTSYTSKQEAESRCYRDIYAKIHENAPKFRSPKVVKRKRAIARRDVLAAKRTSLRDPRGTKQREHNEKVHQVRAKMLQAVARRSTLRSRKLVVDTPVSVSPTDGGDATPPTREIEAAERNRTMKERRHRKKVEAKVRTATEALQNAKNYMEQIRTAYNKLEFSADNAYFAPAATCVTAGSREATPVVVIDAHSTEARAEDQESGEATPEAVRCHSTEACDEHDERDCDQLPVDTAIAMATMTSAQAHNLVVQMKSTFYCFHWLKQQLDSFIDTVKSSKPGDRLPRLPTPTSALKTMLARWQEEPPEDFNLYEVQARTSGRQSKTRFQLSTLKGWVRQWVECKSFTVPNFKGGRRSW
mgnify:CR=1 FL=1